VGTETPCNTTVMQLAFSRLAPETENKQDTPVELIWDVNVTHGISLVEQPWACVEQTPCKLEANLRYGEDYELLLAFIKFPPHDPEQEMKNKASPMAGHWTLSNDQGDWICSVGLAPSGVPGGINNESWCMGRNVTGSIKLPSSNKLNDPNDHRICFFHGFFAPLSPSQVKTEPGTEKTSIMNTIDGYRFFGTLDNSELDEATGLPTTFSIFLFVFLFFTFLFVLFLTSQYRFARVKI